MKCFEKRPKLKLQSTPTDKFLEISGWSVLLTTWIMVILNYGDLPDTIPIHYNAEGVIDGYGNKSFIWKLPLISSLLFIGMTILNMFPHIFNYLTEITEKNALNQYTIATRMMRYFKFIIAVLFGFLVFKTVQTTDGLGCYFTPLVLVLIFIPMIYYIYALIRNR